MDIVKTLLAALGALTLGAIVGMYCEQWFGLSEWLSGKLFGTTAALLVVWVL